MTAPATRTPTSWQPPEGMTFEAWQAELEGLLLIQRATPWLIGDCLNAGESAFGEKYAQGLPESPRAQESLRVYMWVASRVPVVMRVTDLSWSHHRAIARLEASEQSEWLKRAQEDRLSSRALSAALRAVTVVSEAGAGESDPDEPTVEVLPPVARPESQITYQPQGGKAHWRETMLRCWEAGDYAWQRELLDELTLLTLPPSLKRSA